MTTTISAAVAKRLHDAGCRHAFGIPGGEVVQLVGALNEAGIAVHLVKHENCGGFMAEGTWHADRAPAVLFATIGPGIANAVNVVANAWQDRVPMIVLTASVSSKNRHTYTHQVFDHRALFAPITKAAFLVEPGTGQVLIDKALAIATQGRPGPVLLDVPVDVQLELASETGQPRVQSQGVTVPSPAEIARAQSDLAQAKRPVVLAGLDTVNRRGANSVAAFCEGLIAPLITTYKAKGVVPEDQPHVLGGAGLSPLCDEILLKVIGNSDCVVLAGYDPIEMRVGWQQPFHSAQTVIDIGVEPNRHFMHQATTNFTSDVAATLDLLATELSGLSTWSATDHAATKAALARVARAYEDWGPAAIVDEARQASPRNTIATADSGAHRIVLSQIWQCYEPGGLLQSSGFCTMGSAIPLAVGRKIAEPDRPVVAFVGDAGLEMYLGELATIRDLSLGIPIVVFVDEQLALIELKQRGLGLDAVAVDFSATNFTAVAHALGGSGIDVHNRVELRGALRDAFDRDSFTLISAHIGSRAYEGRI
ncbi:MAG: thiamine pyrophosphate-binding protein [Actinobacteria bacterium]|nr:thiamine pyrophosphate-binding protein [Actinomycetota bacterium]